MMLSSLFRRHSRKAAPSAAIQTALLSSLDFKQLLHQARSLPPLWNSARHASSNQMGDALSSMVGQGLEFEEVRDSGADADLRHLDWKATARTGRPHIRVYREEFGTDLHIAMDAGPSMWFGTRSRLKYTQALRLAALFAFSHASKVAGSRLENQITPVEGGFSEQGATELLSRLNQAVLGQSTLGQQAKQSNDSPSLNSLLRYLLVSLKPGTRLIVLSDFIDFDVQSARLIGELSAVHYVVAVQCFDSVEKHLPRFGVVNFRDCANGDCASVDTEEEGLRVSYAAQWQRLQARVESAVCKGGGVFFSIDTEADPTSIFYDHPEKGAKADRSASDESPLNHSSSARGPSKPMAQQS